MNNSTSIDLFPLYFEKKVFTTFCGCLPMCPYEEVSEYIGLLSLNLFSIAYGDKSMFSNNLLAISESEKLEFEVLYVLTKIDVGCSTPIAKLI